MPDPLGVGVGLAVNVCEPDCVDEGVPVCVGVREMVPVAVRLVLCVDVPVDVCDWLHVCEVVWRLLTGASAMPRNASKAVAAAEEGTTMYAVDGEEAAKRTTEFGEEAAPEM